MDGRTSAKKPGKGACRGQKTRLCAEQFRQNLAKAGADCVVIVVRGRGSPFFAQVVTCVEVPRLTTLEQPASRLGEEGVRLLFSMLRSMGNARQLVLPASSGAAKRGKGFNTARRFFGAADFLKGGPFS
jgi:hypothetical protein